MTPMRRRQLPCYLCGNTSVPYLHYDPEKSWWTTKHMPFDRCYQGPDIAERLHGWCGCTFMPYRIPGSFQRTRICARHEQQQKEVPTP